MQVELNFYVNMNQLDAERGGALRLYYVDIRFQLVAHDSLPSHRYNLFTDVFSSDIDGVPNRGTTPTAIGVDNTDPRHRARQP